MAAILKNVATVICHSKSRWVRFYSPLYNYRTLLLYIQINGTDDTKMCQKYYYEVPNCIFYEFVLFRKRVTLTKVKQTNDSLTTWNSHEKSFPNVLKQNYCHCLICYSLMKSLNLKISRIRHMYQDIPIFCTYFWQFL